MSKFTDCIIGCLIGGLLTYGVVGTSGNVEYIKAAAPSEMQGRGWEILRYEGYQFGSFSRHGGKVWYHVKDLNHSNTYYRVSVSMWGGELQFYYDEPESLSRLNFDNG